MCPESTIKKPTYPDNPHLIGSQIGLLIITLFLVGSCIEPYNPEVAEQSQSVLVVDGFIDVLAGSTTVRLTHTVSLQNTDDFGFPEDNAQVTIVTDDGTEYGLANGGNGIYFLYGMTITPSQRYTLHVTTADASEYVSDPLEVNTTPTIDSLTWTAETDGITIRVNTHDPTGASRYYRWDYIETWQYRAPVASDYTFYDRVPRYRTSNERITVCWRTKPSTNILIGSTARLANDIISQQAVKFIPRASAEVSIRYSILVRQRVIDQNEFKYLEQLQKTTESIGGLFDPQPSQLPGNMHCVSNASKPVLGYFSAGAYTEERLFVDFYELPPHLQKWPTVTGCQPDSVMLQFLPNLHESTILGSAIYDTQGFIIGYTVTSPECADCRVQGGTTTMPDFW
jgi:hypothetical protein